MDLNLSETTLRLVPERGLYWQREKTLFVADLHIGKSAAFRAQGLPIPEGESSEVLERLARLLKQFDVERLVILGDFFHGKSGRSQAIEDVLTKWRGQHLTLSIDLVLGNHDLHSGTPSADLNIAVSDENLVLGPFVCSHKPCIDQRGLVLCGHVHPAVRLKINKGYSVKLASFVADKNTLILPAFNKFTGGYLVKPSDYTSVFSILEDEQKVIEI